MHRIIMPQVGQDIPSARIIEWCKDEGEAVEAGEVVLVVESDKAAFEIEAEESGVLLKVLHDQDEEVEIFKPLGYIGRPGESIDEEPEEPDVPREATSRPAQTTAAGKRAEEKKTRILASPSAKRLAKELRIDLVSIAGTGPGGRVTKDDVLAAGTAAGEGGRTPERVVPFGRMRRRIADRLVESSRDIPHFYLSVDVDMTDALLMRKEANDTGAIKVTVTDLLIKACATALREFDGMNAHVGDDGLVLKPAVNVGVAVGTDEGLLVPVIPDADVKTLVEISGLSRSCAEAARRGRLRGGAGGTFTVSSLGMYGVREFLPIINPPECGILAVGAVERRVVPCGDDIVVRDMMTIVLAADHRAIDGAYAAGFLSRVKSCLEDAGELFDQEGRPRTGGGADA